MKRRGLKKNPRDRHRTPLSEDVLHNIEAVSEVRARTDGNVGKHQMLIEKATVALGRPHTFYAVLGVISFWVLFNLYSLRSFHEALDPPPFYWMQGTISLCALLMTTMILTTQNRQGRHAEQRAHLDLQVNLVSEQKIAKLISLIEELRRDLPNVSNRKDPVAESMTNSVDPHAVISALEETLVDDPHLGRDAAGE